MFILYYISKLPCSGVNGYPVNKSYQFFLLYLFSRFLFECFRQICICYSKYSFDYYDNYIEKLHILHMHTMG